MMELKHITHDVDILVSENELVAEEWFGKKMYRVILINEEGEEVSRIFSEAELQEVKQGKYTEHKAVKQGYA